MTEIENLFFFSPNAYWNNGSRQPSPRDAKIMRHKANGKLYMQWADQAGNAGTSRPILVNIGKRGPQGITV